jgi:hypothetical protein
VKGAPLLDLDTRRWAELKHAYGSGADIPPLLRQLRAFPPVTDLRSEPYFSLWSALCHQGDVYSASYAAVPHVVDALLTSPSPVFGSPLQLVACIEIARAKGHGPEVPAGLAAAYSAALRRLPDLVRAMAGAEWDEGLCRVAAAALAVANGQPRLAEAILELEPPLLDDFMACFAGRSTPIRWALKLPWSNPFSSEVIRDHCPGVAS